MTPERMAALEAAAADGQNGAPARHGAGAGRRRSVAGRGSSVHPGLSGRRRRRGAACARLDPPSGGPRTPSAARRAQATVGRYEPSATPAQLTTLNQASM